MGPILASVLLMASSQATALAGYALVAVYTAGFVIPFLAVGFGAGAVLNFFRAHGNIVRYTVKIGGVLLIAMGIITATGWMGNVAGRPGVAWVGAIRVRRPRLGTKRIRQQAHRRAILPHPPTIPMPLRRPLPTSS